MKQLTDTIATPLAEYLSGPASASPPRLESYLGALTPQQFDDPQSETGALLFGAAVHDLGWLRRIDLRGEDRFRWLSGMVTNEVETLPASGGAYNFILNAQGRIQGDACVWRSGDALELEITASQAETLSAHLDHFIIMDDVELAPAAGLSALGLTGPAAEHILNVLGLTAPIPEMTHTSGTAAGLSLGIYRSYGTIVPHYELWAPSESIPRLWAALREAGASPVGAAALETLRIIEGIPAYGIDIESRDLAQETSQGRALSFTKGCYLGQEIVERIRSRGQVHRHLRSLELTLDSSGNLPERGTEVRISGSDPESKPVGTLTSIAALHQNGASRIFAIALLRAEAEAGNRPLAYTGGTAQILDTPPKLIAPHAA